MDRHRNTKIEWSEVFFFVSQAGTRLLRHDTPVLQGFDGAIQCNDVVEVCRKKNFDGASQWSIEDWISKLAKRGGAKNRFQYRLNPNSSTQFLYLRAIQRYLGESAIDPAFQDKVLLPKGFYRVHLSRRKRKCFEFNNLKRTDPRRKKS